MRNLSRASRRAPKKYPKQLAELPEIGLANTPKPTQKSKRRMPWQQGREKLRPRRKPDNG